MARHVAPPSEGRKRSASDCIDRREFHALLVAFRIVIELDVIFEAADQSDDRMLNWKEVEKVLDKLEIYNVSAKQARQKFPDDWTQSMTFKKFTEWCIVRRFHSCGHCGGPALELDENDPEATLKDAAGSGSLGAILKAFKDWDTDQNESISQEELAAVLIELDPTFTQEMAYELFADADINQDGKLDFIEFNAWVTSAVDPEKPASATAADATPSAEA